MPKHVGIRKGCNIVYDIIGITWPITLALGLGSRNFKLQTSHIKRRRQIGLNQSLMYINPFPPKRTQIFLFASLQLCSQRKYSEVEKILGEHLRPPPSPLVTPMYVINILSWLYV